MADNVANKDEGLKCLDIARRALVAGDIARAKRFAEKAARLYSCAEVEALLRELSSSSSFPQPRSEKQTSTSNTNNSNHTSDSRSASSSHTATETNQGTPEQQELVRKIIQAKDFYTILGCERTANEDDIKRAYRKLALKLHPDKCRAKGAEEAFKAVSKAFSCLQNPEKRAYYDRTGFESSSAAVAAQASQRSGSAASYMYTDEFDPEEIFNMFFGGGFPQGRVYRHHFGHNRRAPDHNPSPQQQQRTMVLGLMQLLPVLLLFLFSFMNSSSEPLYSFEMGGKYTHEVITHSLGVSFFVQSYEDFSKSYPEGSGQRRMLERQAEQEFVERLATECHTQKIRKSQLSSWGDYSSAAKIELKACGELERIVSIRKQQKVSIY